MALDLQFGLEEYAGAFALNGEDGALAVSSGRQGRAYVVPPHWSMRRRPARATASRPRPALSNRTTWTRSPSRCPCRAVVSALTDNTGALRLYANLDEGEGKELVKANDVMPSSLRASVDGSKLALCRDSKVRSGASRPVPP